MSRINIDLNSLITIFRQDPNLLFEHKLQSLLMRYLRLKA